MCCVLRPELRPHSPEKSRDTAADDAAPAADAATAAAAAASAEDGEEEADESDLYQTEGGKCVFYCLLPAGLRRSVVLQQQVCGSAIAEYKEVAETNQRCCGQFEGTQ